MATELNRNYASAIDESGNLVFAPAYIWVNGRLKLHANDYEYAAHNPPCYPVLANPAPSDAPTGYHYEFRSYEFAENVKVKMVDGKWMEAPDGTPHTIIHSTYALFADPPPTLEDFDAAMEAHLRTEREARGYTTREPDAYINSAVPRWAQDARDWVAHRDAVMGYALDLINAVERGERTPPTMAEFTAGLPRIEWTFTEGAL